MGTFARDFFSGRVAPLVLAASTAMLAASSLQALPYSAESTTRESLKITATGATPTYAQLSKASYDLAFQETSDGRIYEVFASRDVSIDNLGKNRCTTDDNTERVYWVDKASGLPAECVSYANYTCGSGEASADSFHPLVGGPDGDEGRYVAFETTADEYNGILLSASCSTAPSGTREIVVHDRKWEESWPSLSKCNNSSGNEPDGNSYLSKMSDDGKYLLLTSASTKVEDNLSPTCADANGAVQDIFLRDGSDCIDPGFGECKTDVLIDFYGLHAGGTTTAWLNASGLNADSTPDNTVVVFQTAATEPVHFLPDTKGHVDIYRWKAQAFSLISQTQTAIASLVDGSTVLKNVGGAANGDSKNPKIGETGRWIVFDSVATDLVLEESGNSYSYKSTGGHKQIYIHDSTNIQTSMISVTPDGDAGNGDSQHPWLSRDARFVIFESTATNLVDDITTTSHQNIFMYDRVLERTFLVTPGPNPSYPDSDVRTTQGIEADATITYVSPNGLLIAYETSASDAINGTITDVIPDTNGVSDVFLARNDCPTDTDGDKTPDCLDLCPQDPNKTAPGQCGCGSLDTDSDNDGTADCIDLCPADVNKTAPGLCGCGSLDTDTDSDGTPDCSDQCPYDPLKSVIGLCGCGVPDIDSNGNGTSDCVDPAADLVPDAPIVRSLAAAKHEGARERITATSQYPQSNVVYQFALKKKGATKYSNKSSNHPYVTYTNLASRTVYYVKYRLKAGSTVTTYSHSKSFRSGKRG